MSNTALDVTIRFRRSVTQSTIVLCDARQTEVVRPATMSTSPQTQENPMQFFTIAPVVIHVPAPRPLVSIEPTERLASSVQKQEDDTKSAVIGKVG